MGLLSLKPPKKKLQADAEFEKFLASQNFTVSKKITQSPSIYVDDVHKFFAFSDKQKIYKYSDLIDVQNEHHTSVISTAGGGSAGKALVGGLAFGVTGAIVGASMKKKATSTQVTHNETHIILNDLNNSMMVFQYFGSTYLDDIRPLPVKDAIAAVEGTFSYIKANA